MSLLATWKNPQQKRIFKLINKLLLFQYSEDIFSAHERALTLTLAHKTQLIQLFLTSCKKSRNSSFPQRYGRMILKQQKIINELFGNFVEPLAKPSFKTHQQTSILSIFRGDFLGQKEGSYFDICAQYTASQAHSIEL